MRAALGIEKPGRVHTDDAGLAVDARDDGLPLWPGQVSTVWKRRRGVARTRRSAWRHMLPTTRSAGYPTTVTRAESRSALTSESLSARTLESG